MWANHTGFSEEIKKRAQCNQEKSRAIKNRSTNDRWRLKIWDFKIPTRRQIVVDYSLRINEQVICEKQ